MIHVIVRVCVCVRGGMLCLIILDVAACSMQAAHAEAKANNRVQLKEHG